MSHLSHISQLARIARAHPFGHAGLRLLPEQQRTEQGLLALGSDARHVDALDAPRCNGQQATLGGWFQIARQDRLVKRQFRGQIVDHCANC